MKQVVLITGGTSGIGLALAEAALARGDAVAVCGRSTPALERFADRHPQALAVRCAVTIGADRAALLEAVTGRFGRLDILINKPTVRQENPETGEMEVIDQDKREAILEKTRKALEQCEAS